MQLYAKCKPDLRRGPPQPWFRVERILSLWPKKNASLRAT
jgi:hypothetical protein